MKLLPCLLVSLALALPASAQKKEAKATPPVEEKTKAGPKEAALDELLAQHETAKALDEAITKARKNGVSEQAILEARFLFNVDRNDDDAIAAMLPDILKQQEHFKLADSAIFSVEDDWKSVVEYVQAISDLKKGDKAGFKAHITEAFWLSPKQAAAFAPNIEKLRLEEAMQAIKIDFEEKFAGLKDGEPVALKTLLEGKKALIFHFWSPSSPECEAGMPDFVTTATLLGSKGIAMVSMLPEDSTEALEAARKMIAPLGAKAPGAWLVDRKAMPLARELRVQTLPVFTLVSNEGKILFNGDPSEEALWQALLKIDGSITRPMSEETEK